MNASLKPAPVTQQLIRTTVPFTQAQVERGDTGIVTVSGRLLTYGAANGNGWLHVPGAAKASLAERVQAGRALPMGFQHSPFAPLTVIGKWASWDENKQGITGSGRISDVTAGRDAATLLEDEAIDGISIGFQPLYDPDNDTVQVLAPGQSGSWQTPYGKYDFTASDWTVCFSQIEICEASIVHEPADDGSRVDRLTQAKLEQAAKAMPALVDCDKWDDVAYSMALLMGGRGAGAFADLPDLEHYAIYGQLARAYRQHDKTPPAYQRRPDYKDVLFQHDERDVFADRYLRKTAATLTATARGIQGPLSQETREVVDQARAALDALEAVQTNGFADELRQMARRIEAATHPLQGDTPS